MANNFAWGPETFAGRPGQTCMDALSEILHSVKLDGAVFYNVKLTSPWGVRSPSSRELATFLKRNSKHVIMYHFLSQGHARCEVEHSNFGADLLPGDVVVFPHGDAHILSNGCPTCIMDNSKQLREVFAQGMELAHYGGGGDATLLVCGYMQCDREFSKMFLGGLPPIFKVNIRSDHSGQWLENSIKFSAKEACTNRAGSDAVLTRLSEALFVETMRRYMAELPEEQTGWLAGARDPWVGGALAHIHRTPHQHWTIASLAQEVGMSRSVLAERFRHFLGEPPMKYLSRWRLQLGARKLTSTSHSVARISDEVGYESEAAFNRAFKREFGLPPARFRKRAKSQSASSRTLVRK